MENRLITMVDFVLSENATYDYGHTLSRMLNYANFLNTPLNIGMFVPAIEVDGKWEVFTDPNNSYDFDTYNLDEALEQYQKYKDKVIFEGFDEVSYEILESELRLGATIEELLRFNNDFLLTPYGMELSGLDRCL